MYMVLLEKNIEERNPEEIQLATKSDHKEAEQALSSAKVKEEKIRCFKDGFLQGISFSLDVLRSGGSLEKFAE